MPSHSTKRKESTDREIPKESKALSVDEAEGKGTTLF